MRYQFIQGQENAFSVGRMCRVLSVSRSGYYAWTKRQQSPPSPRETENARLTQEIRNRHRDSQGTYGSPRIFRDLREDGISCGKHRVARLMGKAGIQAAVACRRFKTTTDSDHPLPLADNLLDRKFTAAEPNRKWASDITYIWTGRGWLYLAVVLDLFSRKVVGWSMGERLDRALVLGALTAALGHRKPGTGLLHHSDRGSQYASREFLAQLAAAGVRRSMSRKGNCWDNAVVESFFGTLKQELIHRFRFATREEARQKVFEYIEVWYNRQRRHSTLGYLSPEEFERRSLNQGVPAVSFA